MFELGRTGVAVLVVVAVVVASAGTAVATPIVVDVVGVDPDSPFYGLERLGEQIRMVSEDDQMKERWEEYEHLVDRGKGADYESVLEEFVQKMQAAIPENAEMDQEIVRWMQEHMPEFGMVRLEMVKEFAEKLKDELEDNPSALAEVMAEISNLENLVLQFPGADNETQNRIMARLQHLKERLENLYGEHREDIEELEEEEEDYEEIDDILDNIGVIVLVQVKINIENRIIFDAEEFEEELNDFNESLAEVQAMLEGVPDNLPGRNAVEQQVEIAIELRDKALAANDEGKIHESIALIKSAEIHLEDAETILESAGDWEPEFEEEWEAWKGAWENMKENWTEEGIWEKMMENYHQYAENIRHHWEEEWQNMWPGMMPPHEEEEEEEE